MHGYACNAITTFSSHISRFVLLLGVVRSMESFRDNDIQNLKISYLFLKAPNLLHLSSVSEAKN